jgi:mRNA interferase MazF
VDGPSIDEGPVGRVERAPLRVVVSFFWYGGNAWESNPPSRCSRRASSVLKTEAGTSPTRASIAEATRKHPARPQPATLPDVVTDDVKQGDLYWIHADASDGSASPHAHPHVVVQDDVFNRSRVHTVIVCALTTNLGKATEPGNVMLDDGEGNLPKQSVVVVSQITSIEKARLGQRIGALSRERVAQILDGLRFQQASFFR